MEAARKEIAALRSLVLTMAAAKESDPEAAEEGADSGTNTAAEDEVGHEPTPNPAKPGAIKAAEEAEAKADNLQRAISEAEQEAAENVQAAKDADAHEAPEANEPLPENVTAVKVG